jgi:hypothetical protein
MRIKATKRLAYIHTPLNVLLWQSVVLYFHHHHTLFRLRVLITFNASHEIRKAESDAYIAEVISTSYVISVSHWL